MFKPIKVEMLMCAAVAGSHSLGTPYDSLHCIGKLTSLKALEHDYRTINHPLLQGAQSGASFLALRGGGTGGAIGGGSIRGVSRGVKRGLLRVWGGMAKQVSAE